ncbi:MAG: LLM class flavin-dependent oxidoreductase [Deltaproteobacteria bacterium]|nr:LLM class flavin-dependent oxidoreductase [Deltaproteobacteria bacterium]
MSLPLASELTYGFITTAANVEEAKRTAERAESQGWDSLWVGDHIAFTVPLYDPLIQLAMIGAFSQKLRLGTSVYLLPLRHAVPVAKQVATLDRMIGGRLEFGVGVGGEFANEYKACGVPLNERGARLTEGIELLRKLWTGAPVTHDGRFYPVANVQMLPPPAQRELPIHAGGRSDGALARIGRLCDGWISYVVTAEQYRAGLEKIEAAALAAKRELKRFHTGHLLFTLTKNSYEEALDGATEHLSRRYAMDFRRAAQRYAALGKPADVAARIAELQRAGVRSVIVDVVGRAEEREEQLERFAKEVRPLLGRNA